MMKVNGGGNKEEKEPVYSPTNPLNNSENLAVTLAHPPVIHPPKHGRRQQRVPSVNRYEQQQQPNKDLDSIEETTSPSA